jgi:hypothetical protein
MMDKWLKKTTPGDKGLWLKKTTPGDKGHMNEVRSIGHGYFQIQQGATVQTGRKTIT